MLCFLDEKTLKCAITDVKLIWSVEKLASGLKGTLSDYNSAVTSQNQDQGSCCLSSPWFYQMSSIACFGRCSLLDVGGGDK